MSKKVLLAGPFLGELGWELFCWQGYVRAKSKDFDKTIVISRPLNKHLYEDFAEVVEFDPESNLTEAWGCNNAKSPNELIKKVKEEKGVTAILFGDFDIGYRCQTDGLHTLSDKFKEQIFYQYGNLSSLPFTIDVVIHARNKDTGEFRNWSKDKWQQLVDKLNKEHDLHIACIGGSDSFHLENTEDMRMIEMNKLTNVLHSSNMIVGPSSGPLHLASLCGTKQIVWSTEHNRKRYENDWNPFNSEVVFYSDEDWDPSVDSIYNIISDEL